MNHNDVAKTALELNKVTFDAVYGNLLVGEEYTEKMVNTLLDQIKTLPNESRAKIEEYGNFYKKLREECMKTVDDSFKKWYELVDVNKCCAKPTAPKKAAAPAKNTTTK